MPGSIPARCGEENLKRWWEAWEQNRIGVRLWEEVLEKWKMMKMGPEGSEVEIFKKGLGALFPKQRLRLSGSYLACSN